MTMLDWSHCLAVERSVAKMSGAWVFRGTRVPVKALFENLQDGATLDSFLEWFPGVERDQVLAVLELADRPLAFSLIGAIENVWVRALNGGGGKRWTGASKTRCQSPFFRYAAFTAVDRMRRQAAA